MQVCHERVDTLQSGNPHLSPQYGWAPQHAARYANWLGVNDVVAAGFWSDGSKASPESSVDGWRQSDGHLRCILGQSNINDRWVEQGYDRVGVACGRKFDLAVFGRRALDSESQSTPKLKVEFASLRRKAKPETKCDCATRIANARTAQTTRPLAVVTAGANAMKLDITINHYFHQVPSDKDITRLLRALITQGEKIVSTQDELATELAAVKDQLVKIGTEQQTQSDALQAKIAELTAAIATAGNTTPAVDDALAGVKEEAQKLDDLIPDVTT